MLSFGHDRLPWSRGGRSRVRDLQTQKKKKNMRKGEERAAKFRVGGGGNKNPFRYLKDIKIVPNASLCRALHCCVLES